MAQNTAAKELLREARQLESIRGTVANLCFAVVEEPEQNIDKLGEVLRMFENAAHMALPEARRLIVLSTCELFADVLPSYRIRTRTEKEKGQQAKKETKKLQQYEEKLLMHYKKFTTILAKLIRGQALYLGKGNKPLVPTDVDHKAAVKCAGALVRSHPTFNHAEDLMKMLIPVLNQRPEQLKSKNRSSAIALASSALQQLLREDVSGEPSLLLARGILQFAQSQRFRVAPGLVSVLLVVNVREVAVRDREVERLSFKERQKKLSRTERKTDKLQAKIARQMEETKASKNRDARLKLNSKIIAQVFLLYFKILQLEKNIDPSLLSAVLSGLSKHAHLLSVEYFDDLFAIIASLLERESLSPNDGLACVHTAIVVLSGDGASLQVDSRRFYRHLYAQLLPAMARLQAPPTQRLLDCLDLMLLQKRREISSERALAFSKRLATAALLASPPPLAVTMLQTLQRLLRLDARLGPVLLDADSDKGQGIYDPDTPEPDGANASSTTLWELHGLRRHFCPAVRRLAEAALIQGPAPAMDLQQKSMPELQGAHACLQEAEEALRQPALLKLAAAKPKQEGSKRKGLKRRFAPMPEWLQNKMRRHELNMQHRDCASQ